MSRPTLTIKQGRLFGKISKNLDGGDFFSFQGIPYAKPPLGQLRFKAPQPPDPWTGTLDATKPGNECYSRKPFVMTVTGSEDCLYLNVYTKQLGGLRPVMVFVHGGRFREGSSNIYGPDYLLTEDVVLVTFNYRLGLLGSLSLEDGSLGVHGNAALKDMVMALRWVSENVAHFGGDRANVTLVGHSSGSMCVHYLVLSHAADGLYHKAICQSNHALCSYARGKSLSRELATVLKLKEVDEREIYDKLMEMPIERLFEVSEEVFKMGQELTGETSEPYIYAPTVEKPSEEAVVTKDPLEVLNSGDYCKVPIIFGYTSAEAMFVEIQMKPKKPEMPKNFEKLIPYMLGVEHGTEQSRAIAKKMKNFYYGLPGADKNVNNFYKLHLDNYLLRDLVCAVKLHAATSPHPVYLYRLTAETELNFTKNLYQLDGPGVCHGDDLGYLFKTPISPPLKEGSLEKKLVRRFVRMWTNFAKFGNPNDTGSDVWKPVSASGDDVHFLDIGEELVAGINPEHKRMQFWKEIFSINPLYRL